MASCSRCGGQFNPAYMHRDSAGRLICRICAGEAAKTRPASAGLSDGAVGCIGIIVVIGLLVAMVWGIRSCWRAREAKAKQTFQQTFGTVEAELQSNLQAWTKLDAMSVGGKTQAPVLVMVCEYWVKEALKDAPGGGKEQVRSQGIARVYVDDKDMGFPRAPRASDIKTLVVVLENTSFKREWVDREVEPSSVLEYLIVDWPARKVLVKKTVPPYAKKVDMHPGKLKPFWRDTSFAYKTCYYPDWKRLRQEVKESLAARISSVNSPPAAP